MKNFPAIEINDNISLPYFFRIDAIIDIFILTKEGTHILYQNIIRHGK
jgi:hypothetical protein